MQLSHSVWGPTFKGPLTVYTESPYFAQRKSVNDRLRLIGFLPNDVNANNLFCKLLPDNFM